MGLDCGLPAPFDQSQLCVDVREGHMATVKLEPKGVVILVIMDFVIVFPDPLV